MSLTNLSGLPFQKRKFDKAQFHNALNSLTYGVKVKYGQQKKQITLYQSEVDVELLILLPRKQQPPSKLDLIDLRDVIDIQEQAPSEEFNAKDCLMLDEKKEKHYFIFTNEEKKNLFWQGLQFLIERAYASKNEQRFHQFKYIFSYEIPILAYYVKQMALDLFSRADTDLSDSLSYEEAYILLKKINITISKKELFKKFDEFDQNKDKLIQSEEFITIARDLLQKVELKSVFKKYAAGFNDSTSFNKRIMKKQDFFKFLQVEQRQTSLDEKNASFIEIFFKQRDNEISFNDFVNLVFNYQNTIYQPHKLSLYQSMDQPLTDYFINSSHNTYLMANQLTGESSVQAYINAFRKGCRCIEIDAWDGNDQPIVTHGFTLTSSIKFKDIIDVIKTYGFVWSKYPIIISIENHCNKENQKRMAAILKEILGSSLYLIPDEYASMSYYPSPRQLKRKLIVKAKGSLAKIFKDIIPSLKPSDTIKNASTSSTSSSSMKMRESFLFTNQDEKDQIPINQIYQLEHKHSEFSVYDMHNPVTNEPQLLQVSMTKQYTTLSTMNNNDDNDKDFQDSDDEYTKIQVLQVKDFQRCISMVGINFSIDIIKNQTASIFDIFSLSEEKIEKLLSKHEDLIVNYHKKYFSRIYPKGSRVNSSNYDPQPSFNSGSQIIALNFQTADFPLFIYLSKFQQNGGIYSGYVLKPTFLRHHHPQNIDSKDHSHCDQHEKIYHSLPSLLTQPIKELRITIISGQCLKSEEDDTKSYSPFVEVLIKGTAADEKNNKQQKTKAVANNTFHPFFRSDPMVFNISCPDLAMVVFQVYSSGILSNDLIAQYALDFNCIRQGYRVIPLWDRNLQKIEHGLLFAHIEIIDHKI